MKIFEGIFKQSMDKILIFCLVIVSVNRVQINSLNDTSQETDSSFYSKTLPHFRCNNLTLEWFTDICYCVGDNSILCSLTKTGKVGQQLSQLEYLQYNNVEKLRFEILVCHEEMDIRGLESFTELRELSIEYELHSTDVEIILNSTTFQSLYKLTVLQIALPVRNADYFSQAVSSLVGLQMLDLTETTNLGYLLTNSKIASYNLTELRLSHFQDITSNRYTTSLDLRTFLPLTYVNLTYIDLTKNHLLYVSTGLFSAAPNLEFLDISNNWLTQSRNTPFVLEALMHPALRVFNLSQQGAQEQVPKSNQTSTPQPTLIPNITNQDHDKQPVSLHGLFLSDSSIDCIHGIIDGNISALFGNQSSQYLCEILRNCFRKSWQLLSCDYLPDLKEIVDSSCAFGIRIPIGRNMEQLVLNHVVLDPTTEYSDHLKGSKVCFHTNNLQHLYLDGNAMWEKLIDINNAIAAGHVTLTGLPHVKVLSLANNVLNIYRDTFIHYFPDLVFLNASHNRLFELPQNKQLCSGKLFMDLKILDISNGEVCVKSDMVQCQTSMDISQCLSIEVMNLTNCGLESTFWIHMKHHENLTAIDLSWNKLAYLNEQFTRYIDHANLKDNFKINISHNPITCDCNSQSLHFVEWSELNKELIAEYNNMHCQSENGLRALSEITYLDLKEQCKDPLVAALVKSVSTSVAVFLFVFFCVMTYRRRFRLQYNCFQLQQRVVHRLAGENGNALDEKPQYEYDAFVSYSSDDRFWVHEVLMKTLEETYGFKLVIHYRDILPGQSIQRAIDDYITKSREFILVMSDNFLNSDWCHTEMEATYRESLRRRRNIVIIVLGEVPQNIVHPTASLLLDTYNYLQWIPDEASQKANEHRHKLFWVKLVRHLYGGQHICGCSCLPFGPRAITYKEVHHFTKDRSDSMEMTNSVNDSRVMQNENEISAQNFRI